MFKKFLVAILAVAITCTSNVLPVSAVSLADKDAITDGTEIKIAYEIADGFFPADCDAPESFIKGEESPILEPAARKGYLFDGWYTNKTAVTEVTDLNTLDVMTDEEGNPFVRVYAKWTAPEPEAPRIAALSNYLKGVLGVGFEPVEVSAKGYEIQYANDPSFSDRVRNLDIKTVNVTTMINNKIGGRTYYVRARAFATDSTGERVYSEYSPAKAIFLANGADELEPAPDSGTINSAAISGGSVVVSASIPERILAYDDLYYVVKIDPSTGSVIGPLCSCEKDDEVTMSFGVSGNLMAEFALAVKDGENSYYVMSKPTFIDNPEALASYTAPYPTPASKKGRQGTYDPGIGDKHYFHNLYLDEIIGTAGAHDVAYNYNGKTYYFNRPTHHINYDADIMTANKNGGTVTMQIMIRWNGNSNDLITPTGRTPGYNYYAFNVEEPAAREKLEAAFMFLAEYWSKSNRHVDNWILGNEVNTFLNTTGRWYWAGNISRDAFMTNYSQTFRILYYAVKSNSANSRVFTCTDHTWNDRDRDWGTKGFIAALDSYLKNLNPNIRWNLANHAYTAVLTNADPWNDGNVRIYSVAHSTGASFVSPYNLEVLTNYCASNFGSGCRMILSEVGFSSTNGTNPTLNGGRQAGADVQAAATAYLFYKAQFTGNIDACIFHTGDEGEPGKNFGILGKPAGDVYRYMDTPSYADHCNGYLGLINGATSWEQIIPGFNSGTLMNMPSR